MNGLLVVRYLDTDDHRAEIVPSRTDDLGDVDGKEGDVTDSQDEMLEPRQWVPAQERGEPGELDRFVDRHARQQRRYRRSGRRPRRRAR